MHGPKHPDVFTTLEDELHEGLEFLKSVRKRFPNIEILLIFGNHEDRVDRWIVYHAKIFRNLLKLENQLQLDHLNIDWIPYNERYQVEKCNLYIQHSPPSYGKNGAMTSLERKLDSSYLYGCTHRMQAVYRTGASGELYSCHFNGWLGSTNLTDEHKRVFSYVKGHDSWQHCGAIITVVGQKEFFINQFEIKNYKAVIEGYLYEG